MDILSQPESLLVYAMLSAITVPWYNQFGKYNSDPFSNCCWQKRKSKWCRHFLDVYVNNAKARHCLFKVFQYG